MNLRTDKDLTLIRAQSHTEALIEEPEVSTVALRVHSTAT